MLILKTLSFKIKTTTPKATAYPPHTSNVQGLYPQLWPRFIGTGVKIKGSVIIVIISSLLYNRAGVRHSASPSRSPGRAFQLRAPLRIFHVQKKDGGGGAGEEAGTPPSGLPPPRLQCSPFLIRNGVGMLFPFPPTKHPGPQTLCG